MDILLGEKHIGDTVPSGMRSISGSLRAVKVVV